MIFEQPVQCGAKIIDLSVASRQPLGPCHRVELGVSFLRKNHAICCVTPSRQGSFTTQGQALKRVFTDCFEHGESWFGLILIDSLNEVLVEQGGKPVEDIHSEIKACVANSLSGLDSGSANKG